MVSRNDNGYSTRAGASRGPAAVTEAGSASVGAASIGGGTAGLDGSGSSGGPGGPAGSGSSVGAGTRSIPAPRWLGKRVGRFKLLALLGQGAMGRVFRAEDTLMGRHVALKLLPRTYKRNGVSVGPEMLIREARAAAAIEHPNAVAVYEVNQAGDVCYVAMELLEGGSLRDLVRAAGPMDLTRACLLCAEAAEALAAAHAAGVVHRDVKPANLMLSRQGRCKVVDFGLARVDDAGNGSGSAGPPGSGDWGSGAGGAGGGTGENVGTPQFIAPEILSGTPASAQSDVYSLGGTLWYLLTGRPPYEAKTARELLRLHVEAPVPDLRALRPDAPRGLADAVARALAKRPADRWAGMEQFARVLRVHAIPIAGGAAESGVVALDAGGGFPPPPTPPGVSPPPAPAAGPGRPARPADPFQQPATPEPPPPQPEPKPAEAAAAAPPDVVGMDAPRHHGGPGWPLLAGGGVVIAAVVAVLCIVFLKSPTNDVVNEAAAPPAKAPQPPAAPAQRPSAPAISNTQGQPQAEAFPPSLVARWVADDYETGSNWHDKVQHFEAAPKNAPLSVANAFNGHAGVKLNGTNQYFTVSAGDYPLADARSFTAIVVFKPDSDQRKGERFWEGGGLIGADMTATVDDWGMCWGGKSGTEVVAGGGNLPMGADGQVASPDLELNRTHVAAMTWDYTGGDKKGAATVTLYVDGIRITAHTFNDTQPRLSQIPIALGASDGHGQRPFSGMLAEVRLYNVGDLNVPAVCDRLLKQYASADDRPSDPFDANHLLGR